MGDYGWRVMTSTDKFRAQIKDPNVVRDFPVDVLKAMALDSTQPTKGPWTVTLHPYIYKQVMAYSPDRTLRWRLHEGKVTRASKTDDIYTACQAYVRDIRVHRADVALTLGFKNFAEMSLYTKMAMNYDNVDVMINNLVGKAKQHQEMELEQLQAYGASRGFDEEIEVYDVEFLKRKQRRTLLGMSDEDIRDFLPFPKLLTGIFKLCESLFDLRFEEVTPQHCNSEDFETVMSKKRWAPEVKIYRVIDVGPGGNNQILGEFFLDPYVRDNKGYGGGDKGWYIPIRPHSSTSKCKALGAMILSLPIPNYGKPSLLNIFETEELLRNFGNLLVHVCSSRTVKWGDLSGRTTIETLPSNVIETLCTTAGKQHMAGYSLSEELFLVAYDMAFYGQDYEKEEYQDLAIRLRSEYLLSPPTSEMFRQFRGRDPSHEALLMSLGMQSTTSP